ncbi:MAG: hypothetical protein JNL83_09820 [Myxococcales bacterium]|nr:hypothetical protein [Myxococcales bacterium]
MPRKQRFKPSRKPKPVDSPAGENHVVPPSETAVVDQQQPHREDVRGVIEAVGDTS